jgi:hypothetical protein
VIMYGRFWVITEEAARLLQVELSATADVTGLYPLRTR